MLSAFKVQKLSRLPRARKKIRACGGPVCDNEFVCRSKNIFPVMLKKKNRACRGHFDERGVDKRSEMQKLSRLARANM